MLMSVGGTYRKGRIELNELPDNVREEAQVIVTFLHENEVDLRAHGIDRETAAKIREQLASFEDWNAPEMDIYDDYDNAKSRLPAR